MTTFKDLTGSSKLSNALESIEITEPTPIQTEAIPLALKGKDVVAQAQTGSGKTLAFSIPLVQIVEREETNDKTICLALVPTRELAEQVARVCKSIYEEIEPNCLIGGVDISKQIKKLEKDPRLVVGTPGRVLDLIKQKYLKINNCKCFVLDEADEMLSMGFLEDITTILKKLPKTRQGLFFSATITPRVEMLADNFLKKAEKITIETSEDLVPDIEHHYFEVGGDLMSKPSALTDLIEIYKPSSCIIFCNTKSDTELLESLMRRRGFDARRLNSDLSQRQRQIVMEKIRSKELRFLIATDIAARGIDIAEIELVVNYSIHEQPETYVHRTGRTGRAGKKGTAISLVGPKDFGSFHFLMKIVEREFQKKELPSDLDLANAQLEHLLSIIEVDNKEDARSKLLAKELLSKYAPEMKDNEGLTNVLSKISSKLFQSITSRDSKSLDTLLQEEEATLEKSSKDNSKDKRRGKEKIKTEDSREEKREFKQKKSSGKELRIYISSGAEEGFDVAHFYNLLKEHTKTPKNKIRNLSIRNKYGYFDIYENDAKELLAVFGADVKNKDPKPVTLEVATIISQSKPTNDSRRGPKRNSRGRKDNNKQRNDRRSRSRN